MSSSLIPKRLHPIEIFCLYSSHWHEMVNGSLLSGICLTPDLICVYTLRSSKTHTLKKTFFSNLATLAIYLLRVN